MSGTVVPGWLSDVLTSLDLTLFGYLLLGQVLTLVLVLRGARRIAAHRRWSGSVGHNEVFASPLTPGVSVLVPARDEESGVLDAVAAVLAQRYPALEVVLVDDGSTDRTFALLAEQYGLVESPRMPGNDVPVAGRVHSVHQATNGDPLLVVRKTGTGRRADAVNAALAFARHPLVCIVDADTLLEPDALLRLARPFVEDPAGVIATGGVARPVNGFVTDRGAVVEARLAPRWLARVQVLEYLRSCLLGRAGRADALLLGDGTLRLLRRDLVLEVGGLDGALLAEEAELVLGLQAYLRRDGKPHRTVFVPETVCWTEVPESWAGLARQRTRRAHGLTQLLRKHRRSVGRTRKAALGLFPVRVFAVELLGPVLEVVGTLSVVASLALGVLAPLDAAASAAVVLASSAVVSAVVVAGEAPVAGIGGLVLLVAAGVWENLGVRQLRAWSRVCGLVAGLTGRRAVWAPTRREVSARR